MIQEYHYRINGTSEMTDLFKLQSTRNGNAMQTQRDKKKSEIAKTFCIVFS
jgi:hypothetical protein